MEKKNFLLNSEIKGDGFCGNGLGGNGLNGNGSDIINFDGLMNETVFHELSKDFV